MPIIYPSNCKGITAGALRALKRDGYTTASKGYYTVDVAEHLQKDTATYFVKTEPSGEFMEKIESVKVQLEQTTEAITKASALMVNTARESNKQMQDVSGKMRDGAEKLSSAIDKMMKIAGRGDFAETVKLTESLVDSLERLAELEQRGLLDKVMKAMAK